MKGHPANSGVLGDGFNVRRRFRRSLNFIAQLIIARLHWMSFISDQVIADHIAIDTCWNEIQFNILNFA